MGNGNHCDFLAEQTMKTKLTVDEIEAYYSKVFLPSVNEPNEGIAQPYQGKPIPILVDFANTEMADGWRHFTIQLFDFGYTPGLDWRCH